MSKNILVGITVVALLVALTAGVIVYQQRQKQTAEMTAKVVDQAMAPEATNSPTSTYKNGTYKVDGTYTTPAGTEKVGVMIVLEDGMIANVEVTPKGVAPTSQKMQADFTANYKPMVIGKNIDDVMLTKVSGSSLTPKGFNDALRQIKEQAQS